MAIKPILFNTEMVRANLDGRKSCTRRIVKPQPQGRLCYALAGCDCGTWGYPSKTAYENWGDEYKLPEDITDEELKRRWNPPYHTDDILYVRETWCDDRQFTREDTPGRYFYKASEEDGFTVKWHPSIHMPKEAARIWLKVTDVMVERLQEITEVQAQAEGCNSGMLTGACTARGQVEDLWNSTIKKSDLDRYGWNASPWVWVIEFERCEKPEGV
jgi:hypothetical protein